MFNFLGSLRGNLDLITTKMPVLPRGKHLLVEVCNDCEGDYSQHVLLHYLRHRLALRCRSTLMALFDFLFFCHFLILYLNVLFFT
jgi:hypothetical protein